MEKHTGGSVIAGAAAAAATSIVTAPYYAGVAAVDAGGKVVDYAKDKSHTSSDWPTATTLGHYRARKSPQRPR